MGRVTQARPRVFEEAHTIFFEAMLSGYASDVARMEWPGLPGAKRIEFKKGLWRVVDTWVVGNGGHSAGWTTMFFNDRAFWQMHYQGRYDEQAIPFLKKALLENYRHGVFRGGRGPGRFERRVEDGTMRYENTSDVNSRRDDLTLFDNFRGEETVVRLQHVAQGRFANDYRTPLGSQCYQGMRLMYI